MANRAYLFAVDSIPQNHSDARKCIGISEFNYDIPDVYRLLVSANPIATTSIIWDHPESLAIVGEAAAGKARLERIRQKLPEGDPARSAIDQWLAFLNLPAFQDFPYFILEAGELFDMTDLPFNEQLGTLTTEINQLTDEALSTSVSGETLIKRWAPDTQTHFLYFEPRGTARPDFPAEMRRFLTTPAGLLAKLGGLKTATHVTAVKMDCRNDEQLEEALQALGDVPHVTQLSLTKHSSDRLPDAFARIGHLQEFVLFKLKGSTGIKSLPPSFATLSNLRSLTIQDQEFGEVPSVVRNMAHLEVLYLPRCQISEIPDWIGELAQLKEFRLQGNPLHALPPSFFELTALKVLLLEYCNFTELPEDIGKLTHLDQLSLSHNPIAALPSAIAKLERLELLHIDNCQLTLMPERLGDSPSLIYVTANNNPLISIPDSLRRARLEELSLVDTPITESDVAFQADETTIGPKANKQRILRQHD